MDFCVFHSPFNKLVRKAFARLWYGDHLRARRAEPADPADADPMLGGKVSLRAAFAAAAATAPARLGSEGASSAAELAADEGAEAGAGPVSGSDRVANPTSWPSRDHGHARGPAASGEPQEGCCSRSLAQNPAPGPAAPLAIHAEAGAATAAPCAPPGPRRSEPPCEGRGVSNPGLGLGYPEPVGAAEHPLDAFPADPAAFPAASYVDRALEAAAMRASADAYEALVAPSTGLALDVGNMYTGAQAVLCRKSRLLTLLSLHSVGCAMSLA